MRRIGVQIPAAKGFKRGCDSSIAAKRSAIDVTDNVKTTDAMRQNTDRCDTLKNPSCLMAMIINLQAKKKRKKKKENQARDE